MLRFQVILPYNQKSPVLVTFCFFSDSRKIPFFHRILWKERVTSLVVQLLQLLLLLPTNAAYRESGDLP